MGKLVFQLTSAFAEFERTMIRQRIKAGLKRAVAQGVKLGRPKIDSETERKVRKQYHEGGQVARDRDWHGPSHLKRAWLKASTAILPLSPSFLCVPHGRGDFLVSNFHPGPSLFRHGAGVRYFGIHANMACIGEAAMRVIRWGAAGACAGSART